MRCVRRDRLPRPEGGASPRPSPTTAPANASAPSRGSIVTRSPGRSIRDPSTATNRRVTLRPAPAAREHARRFVAVAGAEIAATLHAVDPADLRTVAAFLAEITAAIGAANRRLTD